MALISWFWGGRRAQPTMDLATEGTIESLVMDQAQDFAKKYWTYFLDLSDASNAAFAKAAKKHVYGGATPPDADRVVVRSWLLAQVARRLKIVSVSELNYLIRPRARTNPPATEALYDDLYGPDVAVSEDPQYRAAMAQRDAERWAAEEARIAHPSFSMTAQRASEAALRIQEQALARETEWQRTAMEVMPTPAELAAEGLARDPMSDRVLWFMEQILFIDILWDSDGDGKPLAFFEALCADAPLTARAVMATWVKEHVEPMVDRLFAYTTKAIADTVTQIRKTTRLTKGDDRQINFLVVGAFYYEMVNEIVQQAGLNENPKSLRMRYLGI